MFKEFEVVRAAGNLTEIVTKGCRGTILMIYNNPSLAYEVEFVDGNGQTLELLTVKQQDILREK